MNRINLYVIKNKCGWWNLELYYEHNGYISDSRFYLDYSVNKAISNFKKEFNLRYKRGIKIIRK